MLKFHIFLFDQSRSNLRAFVFLKIKSQQVVNKTVGPLDQFQEKNPTLLNDSVAFFNNNSSKCLIMSVSVSIIRTYINYSISK